MAILEFFVDERLLDETHEPHGRAAVLEPLFFSFRWLFLASDAWRRNRPRE